MTARLLAAAVLGVLAPLAALLLALWAYYRYGREPATAFTAEYLREPPEPPLPPALAGFIWHGGGVDQSAAVATLLDLIDRGVVDVRRSVRPAADPQDADETDFRMTLREGGDEELDRGEDDLLDLLFGRPAGRDGFLLGELPGLAQADRAGWAAGYGAWKEGVEQAGVRRGYLDADADRWAFWAATAGFLSAVAVGAAAVIAGDALFLAGLAGAAGAVLVSRGVRRRSPQAAGLYAQYAAVRRYLRDFAGLPEEPPDSAALWRRFVVLAVLFGMADEVAAHLHDKAPQVVADPAFAVMAFMTTARDGEQTPLEAMSRAFAAAMTAASSSSWRGGELPG